MSLSLKRLFVLMVFWNTEKRLIDYRDYTL